MTEHNPGWGKSPASRKWHYFPRNDSFSLCRGIGFYFGERDDADDDNSDNCVACKKKLAVLRKQSEVVTSQD